MIRTAVCLASHSSSHPPPPPSRPRRARFAPDSAPPLPPVEMERLAEALRGTYVREGAVEVGGKERDAGGVVVVEILDSEDEVVDLLSSSESESEDGKESDGDWRPEDLERVLSKESGESGEGRGRWERDEESEESEESEKSDGDLAEIDARRKENLRVLSKIIPKPLPSRMVRKPFAAKADAKVKAYFPPDCNLRGSARWLAPAWAVDVAEADAAAGRVRRRPYTFAVVRAPAAVRLLSFFDREVVGGALGRRVTVTWNARLLRSAGVTHMNKVGGERRARIELSGKVVDDLGRLYQTLAHEVCHAAAWIVDDVAKPPHGKVFKEWVMRFERWDGTLAISTCHEYEVQCRFVYTCGGCGYVYGRHSKSIDVRKQLCGKCRGTLVLSVKKASELRAVASDRIAAR